MGENLKSEGGPQNKEGLEGKRYFEYVLEAYPTLFKSYEEATKDHPERKVDAMQEAFIWVGLHMHDLLDAFVSNTYGDKLNIMELNGGSDSAQMSPFFDNMFKERCNKELGYNQSLIDGKIDRQDMAKLVIVSSHMDFYVRKIEEMYLSELKWLDGKITEIKSRTRSAKIKETALNLIPAHHILKAVKGDSSKKENTDNINEKHSDSERLVEFELKRIKIKNALTLVGPIKGKELASMQPLDRINALSLYAQFMIEAAQNAVNRVINKDYIFELKRGGQSYDISY